MAVKNALAPQKKALGIGAYLSQDAVKRKINEVVGGKDGQRLITAIVSATTANPKLQECTNQSILSAALVGEGLKLSPSPQLGQYYMVPFENHKTNETVAQFQLGYKGYIQLALRSGYYKKLNVLAIKEGELVHFDPLNEEIEVHLIEDEYERENAPTTGYYAMFEYLNGFKKAMYWSKEKMISHADRYSMAFSKDGGGGKYKKVSYADYLSGNYDKKDEWLYSSFWYKDFDGMAFKTMLRQLISKWGIMSIEMQTAYENDMGVISEDGKVTYVENDEPEFDQANIVEPVTAEEPVEVEQADEAQAALFGDGGDF